MREELNYGALLSLPLIRGERKLAIVVDFFFFLLIYFYVFVYICWVPMLSMGSVVPLHLCLLPAFCGGLRVVAKDFARLMQVEQQRA